MSRFNTKKVISTRNTNTTNLAGGKAFSQETHAELVQAVVTSMLDDKFYESSKDRIARVKNLIAKSDPLFVAKLAVYTRKELHLRSVSHVLLGELVKNVRGQSFVHKAIIESAERPDDLTEIASYVGTPFPKQLKRGIRNALLKFSPYQLAKYQGKNKNFSLVDLFNLTHPKPEHATKEQRKAWKSLLNGGLKNTDTWESIISEAGSDTDAKSEAWSELIEEDKIGYMALLRNLNNIANANVGRKLITKVINKLTDSYEISNSKQLPFRFYTAWKNFTGGENIRNAISEALDKSVSNAPKFDGYTLVALDVSGSMKSIMDKAAIIASAFIRNNKYCDFVTYDTTKRVYRGSKSKPVTDFVDEMVSYNGGGTATSLVFDTLVRYDRIVIISDNQSWSDGYSGSVMNAYNEYKRRTKANPIVHAIDLQGYGTIDIDGGKVNHMSGFSEKIFDFIELNEAKTNLVDVINNYKLI